ncbi:MAG: HAD family phosphatase [Chloroflexi bacterium]|nr:MAG: HAD family phosphatase [Chloroflexota bacterium]
MATRALIFDFNGTLSDDEHVMEAVARDVFSRYGPAPTHDEYVDRLAGKSDEAMVRTWLGDRDDVEAIVAERINGYLERVPDGRTIGPAMREAVRLAASQVPIAIVSGAARAEIEPVVRAAGIAERFTAVVTSDDVANGKPHPEGYDVALARLRAALPDLKPAEVTVIEDTEAGVAAATAAGMRCLALVGTMPAERLAAAHGLIEGVDRALIARLLNSG